ncbi:TIGR03621 family F420-dependent LLM class oxidoreductase (plasmid) [Streptomyces sp. CG1]|uniref:TIGR03621 family F420-dependent LLM class oxidoreductase n=1 Tax=Streptomyces sp. CG1 TaxID=1287523 RepID=UPI0034E1EE0A
MAVPERRADIPPFRFGVVLTPDPDRKTWQERCRLAERLGYDTLLVPDHLGTAAPFPSLMAAAEVTERPRLGTFVLNAGLWNPVLLARETATAFRLLEGRLEAGLGTGYVRAECEQAGLPWRTPGGRAAHLADVLRHITGATGPRPPVLVGGSGRRLLELAAEHADTAGFVPGTRSSAPGRAPRLFSPGELQERVDFLRLRARERTQRTAPLELNVFVHHVEITTDRRGAAEAWTGTGLSTEQVLGLPTVLLGSTAELAALLREHRDRFGFSYITVRETAMEVFAPVVESLRGV